VPVAASAVNRTPTAAATATTRVAAVSSTRLGMADLGNGDLGMGISEWWGIGKVLNSSVPYRPGSRSHRHPQDCDEGRIYGACITRRTSIGCWIGTPPAPGAAEVRAAISTARRSSSTSTTR